MDSTTCSKCPMLGGFCWKNPMHWFFGLAILPFAISGAKFVLDFVNKLF